LIEENDRIIENARVLGEKNVTIIADIINFIKTIPTPLKLPYFLASRSSFLLEKRYRIFKNTIMDVFKKRKSISAISHLSSLFAHKILNYLFSFQS
jgi:hypothetical protein